MINSISPKPVLLAFVSSIALPASLFAQAVPVGEDAVLVGEDAVPIGEGAVPIGEGAVPVGEDAVPVGEDAVPVGEDAVPVGEDAVPVGEDAVPTNLAAQKKRYRDITAIAKNPATSHLAKGDDASRWKGSERRLTAAIQKPTQLKQTTVEQRRNDNSTWGTHSRELCRSRPADIFKDKWWQQNQSKLKSPEPYAKTKPYEAWFGKSSWDELSQHMGIKKKPFEYRYDRNVVFHRDLIYVNGASIATHNDFVSSARRLAASESIQPNSKWIPIGTYLLSTHPKSKIDPQAIQLAADQFGNISGIYFHWGTGGVHSVKGKVDTATERVVFTIGTGNNITMETGLANLTDDEARLWAHLPNHHSQTWLLARIDS